MNKVIFAFLIYFILSASVLYPDFELPFPKVNSRKKPVRTLKETPELEVGTPQYAIAEENKSMDSNKVISSRETKSKKLTSEMEPILKAKPKVVTVQNKDDSPQQSERLRAGADQKFPDFSRGIYISQRTLKKVKTFEELRRKGKTHGVNFLVIDVQPKSPSKETLDSLISEGFYPVARIVNFDGGLPTEKPSDQRISSIHRSIRAACESGFPEIQLDYIRYADNLQLKLSFETRYKNISGIIKNIRNETLKCENLPYIGADIFGRIPFNQNDSIGQKVEVFAQVVDVLYPMLYPSHFYGMPARIKDPYQTVYDGTLLTLKRSLKTTRVIPYIQGFNMSVAKSGLSLSDYIKAQVKAAYDSGAHGFVVWNAWNDYDSTFQALKDFDGEIKKGNN
ncbi:putative glycoside hydrolase [Leptospira adleri]|uniref:Glycosyl hydrolase n=1 Tax=Leptospira adleri TaxID=2023186 RepID=A0A2M9YNS9_9LEPT|nr:putative glycoside hydrolase [Leptospira adleri]PJZ53202.1 glycosyl hydrolase [Leptospira adleri]PJZ63990.1 glycosyl hydrolase [Leptospira adleri]